MKAFSQKNHYYVDMDGVIADFNAEPNAVARFVHEKGFFANLKPIRQNLNAVKMLLRANANVSILSASPNEQADKDKRSWLQEFLPELPQDKIIIMRNGQVKADFVKDIENAVLIDDYGKNCREFRERGGQAIKIKSKNQILEMVVR